MESTKEPEFLDVCHVVEIHREQVDLFGGPPGLRDAGALESAVLAPQNFYLYGSEEIDIFDLAACYCSHLVRNHPFTDGNKRAGWISAVTFLLINGVEVAPEASETDTTGAFSSREIEEMVAAHIAGRVDQDFLAQSLFIQCIQSFAAGTSLAGSRAVSAISPATFASEDVLKAYCADAFISAATAWLIGKCQHCCINPKRIRHIHQSSADEIVRKFFTPSTRRAFGMSDPDGV
ncbi:hypothetical protein DB345_02415 [Spartobacteria bacterium LR76]|nr:hypothetical protein DB345_02415 [Spartobacteria bacterium LR76]